MKSRCIMFALATAALTASAQEYVESEIHFRYVQIFPNSNLFDAGFGLEGTVRRWKWDTLGYGFSMGLNDYDFDPGAGFVEEMRAGASIQGSAGYIPLQASLLYAPLRTDALNVNLELGLRYMVALTSADVVLPIGEGQTTAPVDIADAITAIAAVHLEYQATTSVGIVLGLGVQQDVVQGEYGVNDVVAGRAEISGAFVQIGAVIDL